jgi:hypothetical protein
VVEVPAVGVVEVPAVGVVEVSSPLVDEGMFELAGNEFTPSLPVLVLTPSPPSLPVLVLTPSPPSLPVLVLTPSPPSLPPPSPPSLPPTSPDVVAFAKLLLAEPALITHKMVKNNSTRTTRSFSIFLQDISTIHLTTNLIVKNMTNKNTLTRIEKNVMRDYIIFF